MNEVLERTTDEVNPGIIEPGNINLHNRPVVKNADGSISTVRSKSFDFDGTEVLLPTVSDDGKILTDKQAIDLYKATGRHLGKFSSVEAANQYAQQLHEEQGREYVGTSSRNDVLDKIRQKYHQYDNIPDDELTLTIAEKYPAYLKNTSFARDVDRIRSEPHQPTNVIGEAINSGIVIPVARTLNVAGQVLAGGAEDFIQSLITPKRQEEEVARSGAPEESNITAIARQLSDTGKVTEPLPLQEDISRLPTAQRIPAQAAYGTVETAPKIAAVMGAQALGVPAPLGAAAVFGATEQGFDPVQATVAAAIPFVGKYSGEISGLIAKKFGVDSVTALNIVKGAGGLTGPAAGLIAQGEYEISQLPEDKKREARINLYANVLGQSALGPVGVKYEKRAPSIETIADTIKPVAPLTAEALKKGEQNATSQRIEQESNIGEHIGTETQRVSTETGGGNRPEPSPEKPQQTVNAPGQEVIPAKEPGTSGVLSKPAENEPELVGMGGALLGKEPQKPVLSQLTESLKTLANTNPESTPKQAFDLGQSASEFKDNVSSTLDGLKAAGTYLKTKLEGKPVWTNLKAAIGDRGLALAESANNAREFAKTATKAVPDSKTQDAIANWIDTGGNDELLKQAEAETKSTYKAGYEAARNLTPEQKTIAQNSKNYFESRLQDAIDAGILEDGIEDYIHRIYESDSPWKQGVLAELRSGIFTGKPGFAKQRVFQYDFEAERAGLKPVKSFIKRIAAYDLSLNKAIADRNAVKQMMQIKMKDGRPMIDVGGVGIPIEGKTGVTEATLIKPSFKPSDTENPLNNRGDYKPYDYPALRKWKWVTKDSNGNSVFVQGDVLIHPDAIKDVKALFERSAVRQNPVGRLALGVSSTIKNTMLDLSGFHFTQITVHGWEHRTFKPVEKIDFDNPDVRGLIRGGTVVGDVRAYELFSEGLTGSSLTKYLPIIGPKLYEYNQRLFNDYIPRLKIATGLHALERNTKRFPNLSKDELYHLTANEMNAAFGELNYEMLGRSKTTQDVLRLALLAPDFLEARGRFAAQAATKYGREQFQALALGAATLYITARIINKLLDGEYHFEPKNAFSVVRNGKAYSLRTVQGDLLHLATAPGQFAYNRLNPVYGRTGFEFLTGRDSFGRKRDLVEQAKDFASTAVPISVRGVLNPREQNLLESFLNSIGITERRSTSIDTIHSLVDDYKKRHNIRTAPGEFVYDPGQDPFRPIRQAALFSSPQTVANEIDKAVKDGKLTSKQIKDHFGRYATAPFTGSRSHDTQFVRELSSDNKKIFTDALKERALLKKKFDEGYQIYIKTHRK